MSEHRGSCTLLYELLSVCASFPYNISQILCYLQQVRPFCEEQWEVLATLLQELDGSHEDSAIEEAS